MHALLRGRRKWEVRPRQSDKNIWHVLWGAEGRRQRRAEAEVEEGGSGAAELSCQLCEKLRFMRVARGVGGGACRQVTAKSYKTHIKY